MSITVAERIGHVATVVLRPVDAFRAAMLRPVDERRPVRPVRLRIRGRVVGSGIQSLRHPAPKPIVNLSGDSVYRDFTLGAGTYRIEQVRNPEQSADFVYEELDPADRDLVWDPAAPANGLPGLPTHASRFVEIPLYPSASYPFPTGTTLIRGGVLWYDGSALAGAVINETSGLSIIARCRPGGNGDFAFAIRAGAASGTSNLQLDLGGVDATSRPDGAAYIASLPGVWPAAWERGNTRSIRQAALAGVVRRADGRGLNGARVTIVGEPGFVTTNNSGRWSYHFPPLAPAGTVDITVQHPDYAAVTLTNIAITADRTAAAPTVVLS